LLEKMKETSEKEPEKFSVRIVSEASELHRTAPSDCKNETLEEMTEESKDMDPLKLYSRSKLQNILFIRELARKHLPALTSSSPIMALSVHPGAVATEQQKGATEAYGMVIGKILENAASATFMSPDQGAESALWAGTSPAVAERREEVQGRYYSEADGKTDTETSQAQDDELARKLWDLSVKTLKEKAGYEVKM